MFEDIVKDNEKLYKDDGIEKNIKLNHIVGNTSNGDIVLLDNNFHSLLVIKHVKNLQGYLTGKYLIYAYNKKETNRKVIEDAFSKWLKQEGY